MRALLLSTYELGHQPLHLAAPAAALQRAGHEVRCRDLSLGAADLDDSSWTADLAWSDGVAISVPMHTALRLARTVCDTVRASRPELPIALYGLYAAVDDGSEAAAVADLRVAGEYEEALTEFFSDMNPARVNPARMNTVADVRVDLGRRPSTVADRRTLPALDRYARLLVGGRAVTAGYTEASRGCAHRCRHCPVPVVYDGRTRVVAVDTVLADVAQLVSLGAEHVTFGDPDFLNGPHHARRVVAAVHKAFPRLTFDITAKVEHVLAQRELWPEMADAGCLFVVSAFESASDDILAILDKGHTVEQSVEAVGVLRAAGIEPRPSLLPFTPWTTAEDFVALLDLVAHCDLVGNVDPVQYSIRLLVPPGSLLLESGHLDGLLGPYDTERLGWSWRADDPRLDELQSVMAVLAEKASDAPWDPLDVYRQVREATLETLGPLPGAAAAPAPDPALVSPLAPADRPRLSEAWFCCAEPTTAQFDRATLDRAQLGTATGGR